MPKKNSTLIVCVLDRSGSMSSTIDDSIGGFNTFIEEQKKLKVDEASVTTVLFDDRYEILYQNKKLDDVEKITKEIWMPRGMTALFDALGKTINDVGCELDKLTEDQKPEKVLFVVVTDGQENSSKEFNSEQVKKLISDQRNIWKWEFLFFGATEDSLNDAKNIGILHCKSYDTSNTKGMYSCFSSSVQSYRSSGKI